MVRKKKLGKALYQAEYLDAFGKLVIKQFHADITEWADVLRELDNMLGKNKWRQISNTEWASYNVRVTRVLFFEK